MKKTVCLLFAIILAIFTASCGNSNPEGTDTGPAATSTESATYTESATSTEAAASTAAERASYEIADMSYSKGNIKIRYPQIEGLYDENLQAAINELIKDEALKVINYYGSTASLTLDVDYDTGWKGSTLLSIRYTGNGNVEGAAHPNGLFYTTNIDLVSGKRIRLADFADINADFINKIGEGKFNLPETGIIGKSTIIGQLDIYDDENLIKAYGNADSLDHIGTENQSDIFSFFTEGSLGISVPVGHAAGDHAEFYMELQDIGESMLKQSEAWSAVSEVLAGKAGADTDVGGKGGGDASDGDDAGGGDTGGGGDNIKVSDLEKDGLTIFEDQCFDIELENWGKARFIAGGIERNALIKLQLYLADDRGNVIYTFPDFYGNQWSMLDSVAAVAFRDANGDGLKDVIVIASYMTGVGPSGAQAFPVAGVYFREGREFLSKPEIDREINDTGSNESIDMVMKFLKDRK